MSQISKYLPGNVMHLASRQLLGASAGVPHAVLARSSLLELAGLASAGLLLSLPALPLIDGGRFRWVTPAAGAAIVLLTLGAVRMTAGALTARILGRHLLFLLTASLIFTVLLVLLTPVADRTLPWTAACGTYAAAWLAGFVTPGAPAGLGVREAVLVLLLENHAAEQHLLPAVVLSRVVSALGDTIFFGAAAWAGWRERVGRPSPSTRRSPRFESVKSNRLHERSPGLPAGSRRNRGEPGGTRGRLRGSSAVRYLDGAFRTMHLATAKLRNPETGIAQRSVSCVPR